MRDNSVKRCPAGSVIGLPAMHSILHGTRLTEMQIYCNIGLLMRKFQQFNRWVSGCFALAQHESSAGEGLK
jgi:hypothetical protein